MKEAPTFVKRLLFVPVFALLLAWRPAAADVETGLEFLDPQALAYVQVRGTVVNHATGAPVQGARVFAVWEGAIYGAHSTSHLCLRVDATTTRADGSFFLRTAPRHVYRMGLAQQYVDIRVHAPGLQELLGDGQARTVKLLPDRRVLLAKLIPPKQVGVDVRVPMIPTKEDVPDRIYALQQAGEQPKHCETLGNPAAVQQHFQALATEAGAVAKTQYQKAVAEALAARASTAATALGSDSDSAEQIMRTVYESPDLSDLERRDYSGATPLMDAARRGDAVEVRTLLAAGASPNRTVHSRGGSDGDSALTTALAGHARFKWDGYPQGAQFADVIHALLADARMDPNLRGIADGYTPLWIALHSRQDDVVEWLLAAGADPNLTAYNGRVTPIGEALEVLNLSRDEKALAAAQRQFDLLITSKRMNLDAPTQDRGEPPVTRALANANLREVKQLLQAGANPNAMDGGKRTPLIAAVEASLLNPQRPEYAEGVRLMASWPGVDFDARYEGKTAFQMVQSAGRKDLVEMLQKR